MQWVPGKATLSRWLEGRGKAWSGEVKVMGRATEKPTGRTQQPSRGVQVGTLARARCSKSGTPEIASQLYLIIADWPWTNHLTSSILIFLICKLKKIFLSFRLIWCIWNPQLFWKTNQSFIIYKENCLVSPTPWPSRDPCPLSFPAVFSQLNLQEEVNQEPWQSWDGGQKVRTVQSKHSPLECLLWFNELLGLVY